MTSNPHADLHALARSAGCCISTVGDVEALAGVNVTSIDDRAAVWRLFSAGNPSPRELFDAVMEHCAAIALARIARGELCLIATEPTEDLSP